MSESYAAWRAKQMARRALLRGDVAGYNRWMQLARLVRGGTR